MKKKTKILKRGGYGEPLFKGLQYCTRCCMPETSEGINFDEMGICRACRSSDQKMHINWAQRERELKKILEYYKSRSGNNYDCIVPISGGKDSTFQLHVVVKVYRLKPLALTFNHNWYTETGKYNLWNTLEKMEVDHIMFTPNRRLVNKLAKKSLYKIGDACWHCHAGIQTFTLNEPIKFDENYYLKVSAKVNSEEMLDKEFSITEKDLCPFQIPAKEELDKVGVTVIHLGDYIFWDTESQVEFIKKTYGWKEDNVEGTYKKYKSVECIMPGVHDYAKFIKRGFGRATDYASKDVRNGLITREEGFELIREVPSQNE